MSPSLSSFKGLAFSSEGREECGFTLVEILVVVIIIGILAAIAIPIYLNQQRTSQDAKLKTDLRNMAGQVQTLETTPETTGIIGEVTRGSGIAVMASGENGVDAFHYNKPRWEDNLDQLPKVALSEGTVIEVSVAYKETGKWLLHDQGEFCLSGTNQYSNFDFVPGSDSGGGKLYSKYLFYDVKAGGVKTMDELVQAWENGNEVSCTGYVLGYMNAS